MKDLRIFIMLSLIAIVGVFTLDVYLPGMPTMANEFNVSMGKISLTFTIFSIVFAISQLFHGVFSDYIGRKPVLVAGLGIAGIATFFCIIAKSYESILLSRILQAIGISVFVVVNAIIRDLFTGKKAVQVRTLVATTSGITISIAPTVGGLLQHNYGWQGGFVASIILIVITLIYAMLFFPESNQLKTKKVFNFNLFLKSYWSLFSENHYILPVIQSTLAYTMHFSFIIISANLFINLLGFTPITFGYLMLSYGGVYFVSGLITSSITKKFPLSSLIQFGGISIGFSGMLMLAFLFLNTTHAWQILFPMALSTLGITMVRAASTTKALATIPNQAGQGAAGLNLIQFTTSALIATCISATTNYLQISLALLALISAGFIVILERLQNWLQKRVPVLAVI